MKGVGYGVLLGFALLTPAASAQRSPQAEGPTPPTLAEAESLAHAKRLPEAERLYRQALAVDPALRAARIGLARVLLWQLRYPEAKQAFEELLRDDPRDVDAREGLATALYWSGDYRGARREFEKVAAARPESEIARQSLAELRAVSRSTWRLDADVVDDDQPYRLARGAARYSFFTDPLTRWDVGAGAWTYDDSSSGQTGTLPFARLGAQITVPSIHLTWTPSVTGMRFADQQNKLLGGSRFEFSTGSAGSRLFLDAQQNELLRTATSIATHPWVTDLGVGWRLDRDGWLAEVSAHRLHYFDQNDGRAADAWVLAPLHQSSGFTLSAGVSGAWRDTSQIRFRLDETTATPLGGGLFGYSYAGVYDPYYAPRGLKEARAVLAATWRSTGGTTFDLHLDGGESRDRALEFGPTTGAAPLPPAITTMEVDRTFHPWRAAATLSLPLTAAAELDLRYEHAVTVFYASDEISLSLVGHL